MNTLANGSLRGEEAASPCAGIASGIFPEAKSSQTGASVNYVPSPDKKWYLFRASYGREVQAADLLIEAGVYTYVPQRYEMIVRDGKNRKVLKSLLPNLVFAYVDDISANLYVKGMSRDGHLPNWMHAEAETRVFRLSAILSFYYNHFTIDETGRNPPLVIADDEMRSFILATRTKSRHLKLVDTTRCRFLDNKLVEVMQGSYKGVRGRVARVAGQQCIVVSLANGEFHISTDYIPTQFIRVVGPA